MLSDPIQHHYRYMKSHSESYYLLCSMNKVLTANNIGASNKRFLKWLKKRPVHSFGKMLLFHMLKMQNFYPLKYDLF